MERVLEMRMNREKTVDVDMPRVLVADDDDDLLGYIKFRLEHAGYEVLTAHNGEEALKLAQTRHPQLAVLDIKMPRMDGLELTRQIRTIDELQEMPIILLTASAEGQDMVRGYEAGANDYLRKPFSAPEELINSVQAVLARQ
jgi:DNA-binding response OmpR family regulator